MVVPDLGVHRNFIPLYQTDRKILSDLMAVYVCVYVCVSVCVETGSITRAGADVREGGKLQ